MAKTMHLGFNSTFLSLLDISKDLIIGYLQIIIRTQGIDMENVLRLVLDCGQCKASVIGDDDAVHCHPYSIKDVNTI